VNAYSPSIWNLALKCLLSSSRFLYKLGGGELLPLSHIAPRDNDRGEMSYLGVQISAPNSQSVVVEEALDYYSCLST
jgi:hypothetical protein